MIGERGHGEVDLKIHARFFALYRERAGQRALDMDLEAGATVGDLVKALVQRFPQLSPDPPSMVVAVNREYARHDHRLHEGDEVAFIPPVSGGCAC